MSRHPLTALPLSHFITSSSARAVPLPSPVSLPAKRTAPGTPETEGSGRRKAVRTITPKARAVLERDELGVGKSPARRLFVDADAEGSARVGSGISGAVATPPSAPSRALAPSPPIIESPSGSSTSITIPTAQSTSSSRSSTRESYFPLQPVVPASPRPTDLAPLENGAELSIHNPGFEIFADVDVDAGDSSSTSAGVGVGVGIGTPNSRRIAITGVTDSTTMLPESESSVSSPTFSSNRYEDQENVPPSLRSTPSNASLRSTSTPSKSKSMPNSHPSSACSASTSTSSTGSSTWYDDEETFVLGSGRRFHGRSKLAQVIAGEVPDVSEQQDGPGGEDLTPGKLAGERNKGKGKERMAEEVDVA